MLPRDCIAWPSCQNARPRVHFDCHPDPNTIPGRQAGIPSEKSFSLNHQLIADGFYLFITTRGDIRASFAPGYQ
jgi:hypothetical protein